MGNILDKKYVKSASNTERKKQIEQLASSIDAQQFRMKATDHKAVICDFESLGAILLFGRRNWNKSCYIMVITPSPISNHNRKKFVEGVNALYKSVQA